MFGEFEGKQRPFLRLSLQNDVSAPTTIAAIRATHGCTRAAIKVNTAGATLP
jgi:hypothetical protein